MTESEWLACTDPQPMLEFLKGKASDRKLRLFSCACHYRVWNQITDDSIKPIILAMERMADGQSTFQELNAVYAEASAGIYDAPHPYDCETALCDAWGTSDMSNDSNAEAVIQASLLRALFNNPFHPVKFDPAWLAPLKALAQRIYDDRSFDHLPILADELEKAGCANPEILGHCRGAGHHVRGCWVMDLVLGKE